MSGKFGMNAPHPKDFLVIDPDLPDQIGELLPPYLSGIRWCMSPLFPCVKARTMHLQQSTHERDSMLAFFVFDQLVLAHYRCSFAKKAAAFFRNVFSSRNRLISRCISCGSCE
ncbi:MAG: hypothetical protein L0H03_21070 [Rhodococcus sp. (in: high G+C Gram-positive bacteria)]|nr:hypothetical protein [Rhodococcus sp. (in: high G+C Gram-positive bacteria)]